jgi:hypothetical protein
VAGLDEEQELVLAQVGELARGNAVPFVELDHPFWLLVGSYRIPH